MPAASFQSTHPLRGATATANLSAQMNQFQSTRPLRGATVEDATTNLFNIFQSTRPLRGATPDYHSGIYHYQNFNPRAPCGARQPVGIYPSLICNFNPRAPCGARRSRATSSKACLPISIHAPLAGRDEAGVYPLYARRDDFNPRTPCGVRRAYDGSGAPTDVFQSTHPLRGATKPGQDALPGVGFQSTHPLRGATVGKETCISSPRSFQSTHPLRGATAAYAGYVRPRRISIHAPLAGCDTPVKIPYQQRLISIHAPLAGCDISCCWQSASISPFQSTHPLRGATVAKLHRRIFAAISIHAPLAGCDQLRRYQNS